MAISPDPSTRQRRRVAAFELVGACLVILVLAQALIGLLGLASYSRLAETATAERVELLARDTAAQIETGLRLGRLLAQYSGLPRLLESSVGDQADLVRIEVALPDGRVLGSHGQAPPPGSDRLVAAAADAGLEPTADSGVSRLVGGAALYAGDSRIAVAVGLHGREAAVEGVLSLWVDDSAQAAREAAFFKRSAGVLALTTLAAISLLALIVGRLLPVDGVGHARWQLAVPLAAMLVAQGLYALDATTSFRSAWLESTRGNVVMLAERTQGQLNRVFDMGMAIERLRGVDAVLARLAGSMPVVESVAMHDADGRVLVATDAAGAVPADVLDVFASNPPADDMRILLPLMAASGTGREPVGTLEVRLDSRVIAAGVRARVLDAGTVALISAITAVEMFLLVAVLITRSRTGATAPTPVTASRARAEDIARVARPVMFGFLFAWALPLSFLPLYAGGLDARGIALPGSILVALPISAEMLLGLCGVLLAGRLTDVRSWRVPVLNGLVLAAFGSLASAMVASLGGFVLARGLVGFGYGLAWMGLHGFVVTRSSPVFRGRNIAWLIAGLFAGHLSGTAVGAMLADQAGYRPVFVASTIMLALPFMGVLLLAQRQRRVERTAAAAKATQVIDAILPTSIPPAAAALAPLPMPMLRMPVIGARTALATRARELWQLVASRDFGALLAGCVVPFSVAQVGLLYFALPLYLQTQGAAASTIGRIIMLYGLCMIYLGPLVGRVVDRCTRKKPLIALGGLLGSAGLLYLYFDDSIFAVSLAVFLLALGSCWCGAAQTSWMLSLPNVQRYGPGSATSVLRAADKFGQMIGPLFVGVLFTIMGVGTGLAFTGLFYLVATLLFIVVAPSRSVRPAS